MAEKDKVITEKIKLSGIFNFKDTYQFAYRWLNDEDYDVEEQKYVETVSGDSKDIDITWVAVKKLSDYFRSDIKMVWRILGMTDVEAERDGKRIKTNKGNFEIKFAGTLTLDYDSKWDVNPFMKFVRDIYDKYVVYGRLKQREQKVFGDVEELLEQIKAYLAITGMK